MEGVQTPAAYATVRAHRALELLVLAAGPAGCAAVDLGSGALVRAHYQRRVDQALHPYDIVTAELGDDDRPAFAPDSVVLAGAPVATGQRLRGRRAERYLRPLLHPPDRHLLGSAGLSVPYWTLRADSASLALLVPSAGPVVERGPDGLTCRFRWRRLDYVLPLEDPAVIAAARHPAATRLSSRTLPRALGWTPERLLVALTPPRKGHCYKVVAGMLPRP